MSAVYNYSYMGLHVTGNSHFENSSYRVTRVFEMAYSAVIYHFGKLELDLQALKIQSIIYRHCLVYY